MTVAVFLVSLCGAMALGMPIAFSLIVCAVALMLWLGVYDTQIIAQNMIIGADSFQLLAIPFFLLAGELMNAGGLSKRIVNFALSLVGHLHGGLGYVAIFAAIIMASLSGSAAADTAALASILLPMMRSAGYDVGRSAGLIASGGIIAPIIPPSIGFIVFGVAANLSITKLFLAGVFPGLLIGLSLVIAWWIVCRRDKITVLPRKTGAERLKATWDGSLALLMPIAILGGIRFGIVTPTEAAVVATVYALIVGMFVYRELKPSDLYRVTLLAAKTTSAVMLLVAAAVVSAWLITQANIPAELSSLLEPFIGQQDRADDHHHAAGHGGRHGARLHPDGADPDAGADADRQAGRDRPDLFRRPLHHQQRHRPDHAAGRHRAQRRLRRRPRADERGDAWRLAVLHRPVDRDVPARAVPAARDGAARLAQRALRSAYQPKSRRKLSTGSRP